ncbi:MAG: peptide chain release factor N(5)-glutamine methyltransferase [Candidatus Binataceae bacterium]|nr:peptide chain release factor N(5)-glutamine methyltransferase [Candidatus Binataceae bacterium]
MVARAAIVIAIFNLIDRAATRLAAAGIEAPRLDAELLLAHAAGKSRIEVIGGTFPCDDETGRRFEASIARRAAREPLAYITGHREFYSLDLLVTPAVLIPRPETEMIVEAALEFAARHPKVSILDMGTGSGCIALAIAANAPAARIVASDISATALAVARANAERLGLANRIEFVQSDLFGQLNDRRFDLIVSNPPYVEERAALAPEIRDYEPAAALFAGPDGMACHRRIAASMRDHLTSGGVLITEIGAAQADGVIETLLLSGAIETDEKKDLAGLPRAIVASFPEFQL